ncbi:DUF3071 domain-containing protein [Arcanobacterium haemolyticum]|nr:DUF3071 domain-containing protein [Arcanobacterium haemolyticum]
MIELELLGLAPDGEHLTLNDARGNRYSLPVTDSLRASLRKDIHKPNEPVKQMSPKEVQKLIREGKSIEDVCEISALPAARVSAFAHPIIVERDFVARRARSFTVGREVGAPTVEEVVTSRLVSRGVKLHTLSWDAVREAGAPWQLIARFLSSDRERKATWNVDMDRRLLEALDDEAAWLSETQISTPSVWRPANTPEVAVPSTPPVPSRVNERIDDVLASLDAQRGKPRPMPEFADEDAPEPELSGAHPATSQPEEAQDATILSLPARTSNTLEIAPSFDSAPSAATSDTTDDNALFAADTTTKAEPAEHKKKRNSRPAMPTWDEIVFGKKD